MARPSAGATRANNMRNATQIRQVHDLLDRLGAPDPRGAGSPRERLFYLIRYRGWTPNVTTLDGTDPATWASTTPPLPLPKPEGVSRG